MRDVLLVCGLFAASAALSECLISHKLQSALGRVLTPYIAGLALALVFVRVVEPAAVVVFWAGMLTVWLGVRSHLESSIMLQMLLSLRDGEVSRPDVLARYLTRYGSAPRMDELVRGGFLVKTAYGAQLTRKGRFVARAAQRFG